MKILLDLIRSPIGEVCGFICFFTGALYISSIFSFTSRDTVKQYQKAVSSQTGVKAVLVLAALMGLLSRIPFRYLAGLNQNRYPVYSMPNGEYCYEADVTGPDGVQSEKVPVSVYRYGSNSDLYAIHFESGKVDISEGLLERGGKGVVKTESGEAYEVIVSDQLTAMDEVPMMTSAKSVFGYLFDTVGVIGAFLLVYTVFAQTVPKD